MKEYIKNLSVGLAFISFAFGIGVILFNIGSFLYSEYEFNVFYASIILLVVLVLHGSSIIGKAFLNRKKI